MLQNTSGSMACRIAFVKSSLLGRDWESDSGLTRTDGDSDWFTRHELIKNGTGHR